MVKLTAETARRLATEYNASRAQKELENVLAAIEEYARRGYYSTGHNLYNKTTIDALKKMGYKIKTRGETYYSKIHWSKK